MTDAGPTSSTAKVLERWVVVVVVRVVVVVVGGRGRTRTAQGHVAGRGEWAEVLVEGAMGLVPGFAAYPSSTTVELERVGVRVVVRGEMTRLSDDEDAVEDVGSELDGSKRWDGGGGSR